MTQTIVLPPAPPGSTLEGYDLRIGPLSLQCPLEQVAEQLGDGLEQIGAALTPAERRPRPLKLKLPVRGYHREPDPTAAGRRQRRHVRQLLNNTRWTSQGLYWSWDVDPDLDGWLLIGGGELVETNEGVTFADYELTLDDIYLVARQGTHRMARRLDIADRRGGTVPRDTRGKLYSTSFSTHPLLDEPLVLPGNVLSLTGAANRTPASTSAGPAADDRTLWRSCSAINGEAVSFMPDTAVLSSARRAPFELEDLGAVRVWDLGDRVPPDPELYSDFRDRNPGDGYGWERLLGDPLEPNPRLAIDNGWCRLLWLGSEPAQGLAIEFWDPDLNNMRRQGRVHSTTNVVETTIVELTPERAVVEWRAGAHALRAILQRGWTGPRLEAYNDNGGPARLEYAPTAGAPTLASATPTWVDQISADDRVDLWARGTSSDTRDTTPEIIDGPAVCWEHDACVVGQLSLHGGDDATTLASRSLADAQSIPTLVARRQL